MKISLDMGDIGSPKILNDAIAEAMKNGEREFEIDTRAQQTYPNVCAPVAGVVDFYTKRGLKFSLTEPQLLKKVSLFSSSDDVQVITDRLIEEIRESDKIERGIISGIEWCINESMDNVLNHSSHGEPRGFIMGRLQKENHKLAIAIFDCGIGIYNSLKNSKHKPQTQIEAIEMALRERTTRDEKIGQGNGMWGLRRIIEENGGSMRVSSAGAEFVSNGSVERHTSGGLRFDEEFGSTLIDFQLDYSKPIDIAKALNGHLPFDKWIDDRTESNNTLVFNVAEDSVGTGTRQAAIKFRNAILNTLHETGQRVVLDFKNVELVSSSYADELIGKIINERGFMFFINNFTLKNVSQVNFAIINRSVEMRMAQKHLEGDT